MLRNIVIGVVLLGIAVFAGVQIFKVQIGARLFDRAIEQNMGRSLMDELPDGLHVALCGAGSPMPDRLRNGPCTAVIAGDQLFIVDIGSGAARNLGPMQIPSGRISAIFLTHFHSDHIDGLGELMMLRWVGGNNTSPVPVYGPTGVGEVVNGFNAAYRLDAGYRVAHHGEDIVPPSGAGGEPRPFRANGLNDVLTVFEDGDVKVTAFSVDHTPIHPAVAYRFDYMGRSVVISGDTVKHPNLIAQSKDVDLLVHEALNAEWVGKMQATAERRGLTALAQIAQDILDYHATPVEAAEVAQESGAKSLVLSHVVPPVPIRFMEAYYLKGTRDAYDGPITLGRDGMLFSLPTKTDEISVRDLF